MSSLDQPLEPAGASEEMSVHPVVSEALGGAVLVAEAGPTANETEQEPTKEQKLELAGTWLDIRTMQPAKDAEAVPVALAPEISVVAQRQVNILDDEGALGGESDLLETIRDEAAMAADELDFALVLESGMDWGFRVRLNEMHGKFKQVSREALSRYLGKGDMAEYNGLRIRNIVADHAPDLITGDLKTVLDPSQPLWQASSAQARILLRSKSRVPSSVADMPIAQIPAAVSEAGGMSGHLNETTKPLAQMDGDELALYVQPEHIDAIRERGYALYHELGKAAREGVLTNRIVESIKMSGDQARKDAASARNRELESAPMLQQGDLVHATGSPEVVESVLTNGLRCGEAIINNDRSTIKYPFTVSFLEVSSETSDRESAVAALGDLRNEYYGAINLVFGADASAMESPVPNQRQVFGGKPSTELKRIIIRNEMAGPDTVQKVIQAVVKNGMFVPMYSGTTGEPLLTSEQFDQLSLAS
jgi:hypothetical protein